ncbi:NAD(P)-dependent dehydrogenase, short-chain alcohol dehydrogenase family [Asanoa hainanensis]|uniref:Probable oxidoreductase n=1 Tax=Asanoa hainanensis TaxID=560556 RepID=A0A239NIQ9_9ACTN|nr:SDR family NAD(P)-dependent oxidoreductase [Asanoa hainanensis]SNT54462.1 NAD(P)-dependent dehydrogenase, short-chain alcohol dehydrogenase family [Asanoa hainanensis]
MTEFDARTTAAQILAGVDLTGRRMIVTGGASGIGAETVRALAGAGAEVTVATREPADAKPIIDEIAARPGAGRVSASRLDLADLDSVAAFADGWSGPLHALVANAGIMALPTRQTTPGGWELQLATNYLGHFALAYRLHDALAAAGDARVVTVSSGAHLRSPMDFEDPQFERRPYEAWAAYAQSKTADVLLAVGIARRWAANGITANAVAPGSIHTKLQRHLDRATMMSFGAMSETGELVVPAHFKTPEEGASTTVLLAASPTVEGVTGRYFEDNRESPVVPGGPNGRNGVAAHALDPEAADRLWELALPLLG